MAQKNSQSAGQRRRRIWIGVGILLLLFALAGAWKWTPLADYITIERLSRWSSVVRDGPAGLVYLLGAYMIGSVLLIPITALILLTAIIFGPMLGSVYSLVGCLAGAAITYAIGYFLGQDFVQKIAGSKWQRLEKRIAQTGIVAVATLRLLPVAPFAVVNIVSGAFKVPLWHYILGSLLGLVPGILVTNVFAQQLQNAIRNPGPGTFLLLAAFIAVTIAGTIWLKRKFSDDKS